MAEATTTTAALTKPLAAKAGIAGFIAAHPIPVAIVGGIAVGTLTYYLVNSFFAKKEKTEEDTTEAASEQPAAA